MDDEDAVIGKVGRVSGRIGPNRTGEVILPFGSGTNAYLAHPADGKEEIEVSAKVVVIDFVRPLTVYVTVI